jgi:ABC-type dipeptide/oligopeptide/nickel transport system permease component
MLSFLARRVAAALIVLLAASFLTFAVGYLAPGDPVKLVLGSKADPEAVERLSKEYGLDRGFWAQFWGYLERALAGDFGYSHRYRGVRVGELLKPTIPATAQVSGVALALSLLVGVPLGSLCAVMHRSWLDRALIFIASFLSGIPVFVAAFAVLYLVPPVIGPLGNRWLASLVLSGYPAALFLRLTRSSVLEVLAQDYIIAARARGTPTLRLVVRHALANAMPPVIAAAGTVAGALMAGTFFVERVFRVPGMASFAVNSVLSRDHPVMLAVTLLFTAVYTLANLASDVVCAMIDPRMRRGEGGPS